MLKRFVKQCSSSPPLEKTNQCTLLIVRHLHDALSSGEELQRAARSGDVAAVNECLADGDNVNGRDQSGWTALHRAAVKGRMECVQVLVSHGAEIDAVDGSGFSVRLLRSLCFVFSIPSSPKSLFRLLHSEDKHCCLDEYSSSISSHNQNTSVFPLCLESNLETFLLANLFELENLGVHSDRESNRATNRSCVGSWRANVFQSSGDGGCAFESKPGSAARFGFMCPAPYANGVASSLVLSSVIVFPELALTVAVKGPLDENGVIAGDGFTPNSVFLMQQKEVDRTSQLAVLGALHFRPTNTSYTADDEVYLSVGLLQTIQTTHQHHPQSPDQNQPGYLHQSNLWASKPYKQLPELWASHPLLFHCPNRKHLPQGQNYHPLLIRHKSYAADIMDSSRSDKYIPVSRLAMMVSSPNLAFFHIEPSWIKPPSPSSPRNSHDLVVCNRLALFKNTDITSRFSAHYHISST
nr:ankyrin repeat domain-containing protein 50-like [Ipomoea batatas]